VSDIYYRNLTLINVGTAFQFTLNYHSGLPPGNASSTPQFHNILATGITSDGAAVGFHIDGLPESNITGLTLDSVTMTNTKKYFDVCDFVQGSCTDVNPSCPPCLSP
jgi:hypothetical protein